jgi:hypothetical protein
MSGSSASATCRTGPTSALRSSGAGWTLDCARWSSGRYRLLELEGVRDIIRPRPTAIENSRMIELFFALFFGFAGFVIALLSHRVRICPP